MVKQTIFHISGMTCAHCQKRVESAAKRVEGVCGAKASFSKKRAEVMFDEDKTDEAAIRAAIEKEGYAVRGAGRERQPFFKVAPVILIVAALYFLLRYTVGFDFIGFIPKIDSAVSLGALFVTGLLTSVHCVAMCGGINLSQSVGAARDGADGLARPLLYNLGRVVSYTAVGAIVGGLGSALFISQTLKAGILAAASLFMLLMGLSMLGWLPWWLVPRLPAFLLKKTGGAKAGKGPFAVGLLNGLMPCGPLQAMQLYALATGSALTGALSMLLFSLGTVPLMLGAGVAFSLLKGKFTRAVARVGAVLVLCFALIMAFNATALIGAKGAPEANTPPVATPAPSAPAGDETAALIKKALGKGYIPALVGDGVQTVEAELDRARYPFIIVEKGVPVEFTITAKKGSITGCNASVALPSYGLEQALEEGENLISFTPDQEGLVSYTCWMGMVQGKILVVDSLDSVSNP